MQSGQPKHPPSLIIFFATEMWERYGFYVVQTLLAIYLSYHFGWDDEQVYPLVATFTALTFISPVIGGWMADRLLGQRLSILIGAVILSYSYFLLSIFNALPTLAFALAGISVGTGLLKPNISSLLGNEYPYRSPLRERGFTLFYMGITTGIILGTTLPSYFLEAYGWHRVFQSASISMVLAVFIFCSGVYLFKIKDYKPHRVTLKLLFKAMCVIGLMWYSAFIIFRHVHFANTLFILLGVTALVYVTTTCLQETGRQARQTLVIGLLCLISIVFWSFYFQMFSSILLLLKRISEGKLFNYPFHPPYYVAVQSAGMIVFGILFARDKSPSKPQAHAITIGHKFFFSIVAMAAAYFLITLICSMNTGAIPISPLFFIPVFLLISIAELLLSPVGLSAMTLLASPKKVSTMMGIFFVSLGLGGFFSGKLANLTALSKHELSMMPIGSLKAHYAATFTRLLYILLFATFVCFLLNQIIKRLMRSCPEE